MRYRAIFVSLLLLATALVCATDSVGATVPFPYYNETLPTQTVTAGEPIRLDLRDFICGVSASEISRIISGKEIGDVVVFQESKDSLKIAISYPKNKTGIQIFPIRFEFANGDVSNLYIAANIKPRYVATFSFKPATKAKRVVVTGTFNGWNTNRNPLSDDDGDGVWTATIPVEPGIIKYKFVADGKWFYDPANPKKESNGYGGFNSVMEIGKSTKAPQPLLRPLLRHINKPKGIIEHIFYYYDSSGKQPLDRGSIVALLGNERLLHNFGTEGDKIIIPLPENVLEGMALRVFAKSKNGVWASEGFAQEPRRIEGEPVFDWRNAIIYFAFTDRFYNGNPSNDNPVKDKRVAPPANWMGGDFAGIEKKIKEGYFNKLGVNAIWISPVNKNPQGAWQDSKPPHRWFSAYHGYWTVEPRQTEPHFGSLKELKSLVKTAHRHGIKIIFDFVSNHVHKDHPYFKKHRDWFGTLDLPDGRKNIRLFDEYPFTTWFDTFLPSFDYPGSLAARRQVVSDALWWLQTTGADGFRHDATKHIPLVFWRELCQAIRSKIEIPTGRKIYQVGETISDRETIMGFVGPGLLAGQFDYPLMWTIRDAFAKNSVGLDELDRAAQASRRAYGHLAVMSPFISSHDFSRFIAFCDGDISDKNIAEEKEVGWREKIKVEHPQSYDRLFLALAFAMTQPGAPMIYYGDEFGMTGAGDPDNRRPMRFGKGLAPLERKMLARTKRLLYTRRTHSALWSADSITLHASKDRLVFLKCDFAEKVLCAFNRADTPASLDIQLCPPFSRANLAKSLLEKTRAKIKNGRIHIDLPPRSAEFFCLKGAFAKKD